MSTGKTKQCMKLIKYARGLQLSTCHITSRKTFTDFNATNYHAKHYREHNSIFETDKFSNLMIQVESIMRIDVSVEYPKVLVLDEFISLKQHVMSSEYMKTYVWQKLVDLIKNCRHLIVMDAYLNKERIMQTLTDIRGYDRGNQYIWKQGNQKPLQCVEESIDNTTINTDLNGTPYKRTQDTIVQLQVGIPQENELCDEIISNVLASHKYKKKTAIYTTSKKFGYRLQVLLKALGLKVCYLNGDGDSKDFNDLAVVQLHKKFKTQIIQDSSLFNDYDVVIYTQTLGIGISLENNSDFQNLIGIVDQQRVSGANEAVQSLFRFRNIHQIKIYSHGFNFGELLDTLPKAHEAVQKQNIFEAVNPAVNSEVYQFQLSCIVERSIQKHQFNLKLVEYLLRMGVIIQSVLYLEDSKTIKGTSKKFKFGEFEILPNDMTNFEMKNEDLPYIVEQFDIKNRTLQLIKQLNSFEYIEPEDYTQRDWLKGLNDHIKEKRNWYMNLMKFHSNSYQEVLNIHNFDDCKNLSDCFKLYIEKNKSGLMPQQIQKEMREIHRLHSMLTLIENRPDTFQTDFESLIRGEFKENRKLITLTNQNVQMAIIKVICKYTPYTSYLYYNNCWQKDGKGKLLNNKDILTLEQSLLKIPNKQIIDFGEEDGSQLNNIVFIPDADYIRLFIKNYTFSPDLSKIERYVLYKEPIEEQIERKKLQKRETDKKRKEQNKEQVKKTDKKYYEQNKEQKMEYQRKQYAEKKSKISN